MSADRTDRWEEHAFESGALRGNVLGDPHVRPLFVWTPQSYDAEPERRYPSVYVIQGMTGIARAWFNTRPWETSFPDAVTQLGPEAIVVLVDAFTAVGGSQFIDSPAIGRYHTYLCDEIVPWIDDRYRTLDAAAHRGIQGKSSGGYGAMVTPMLRPDLFGGLASHAGDSLYELCYVKEFGDCVRYLREYGGDIWRWWDDFRSRVAFTRKGDETLLMTLGVSACFSADPDGTVRLPFDARTGQLIPELWDRWLAWDPVRMVPSYADALRGVRAMWIDAGTSDEWYLDL